LVIQTIRRVPSRSDWIDDPPDLSRADPSGADQTDAEHQATDLVVWSWHSTQNRVRLDHPIDHPVEVNASLRTRLD